MLRPFLRSFGLASGALALVVWALYVQVEGQVESKRIAAYLASQGEQEPPVPWRAVREPSVHPCPSDVVDEPPPEDVGSYLPLEIPILVVDATSGGPVARARVELWRCPTLSEWMDETLRGRRFQRLEVGFTDLHGALRFVRYTEARALHEVRTCHPDLAPARHDLAKSLRTGPRGEYVVRMNEGIRLFGRVEARASGEPLADARVLVRRAEGLATVFSETVSEPAETDLVVTTDATGEYEVRHAPLGCVEILVRAEGHVEQRVTQLLEEHSLPEHEKRLDFRLDPGGSIHGYVEELGGVRLADVEINARHVGDPRISNVTTRSDAEGRFRLEGLVLGAEYEIEGRKPGFTTGEPLRVRPDTGEVLLRMDDMGRVRGRVLHGSHGRPSSSFVVTLFACRKSVESENGVAADAFGHAPRELDGPEISYREIRSAQASFSGRSGRFELKGAIAEGNYAVRIEAPGFAPLVSAPFHCARNRVVELGDFELNAGCRLIGTVVDPCGVPVAGAKVQVSCGARDPAYVSTLGNALLIPEPLQRCSTTTDERGRFCFERVIASPFVVVYVQKGSRGATHPTLTATRMGRAVAVPPIVLGYGGGLRGKVTGVTDANGSPGSVRLRTISPSWNQNVLWRREIDIDGQGAFEFRALPAGRYAVWFEPTWEAELPPFCGIRLRSESTREIAIEEGRTSELELECPRSIKVGPGPELIDGGVHARR